MLKKISFALLVVFSFALQAHAEALTLRAAVERALHTNPSIEAARANRRATAYELRQSQGRLLPQLRVDAYIGRERFDQPQGFAPDVNNRWRTAHEGRLTLRQIVFDGWDRANDIYKHAARVDAASHRVMARSELLGLDAIEAFIDVHRHRQILSVSKSNVARHRRILADVDARVRGGRAPASERLQVEERLAAAEAARERVRQSLLEAEAKFLRIIGRGPARLQAVRQPPGVPVTRAQATALVKTNPLVSAADADADTARAAFDQTKSGYLPQISVEAGGALGYNIAGTPGRDNEAGGRVVLSWNVFDGLITRNRRREFAERWAQALAERDDRVRETEEEIDKALAARSAGRARVTVLRKRAATARKVVDAYAREFEAAKRSLLDLLESESSSFNARVELASAEAIHVFSGYRLLAGVGNLLSTLGIAPPPEARAIQRQTTREAGPFAVDLPGLR